MIPTWHRIPPEPGWYIETHPILTHGFRYAHLTRITDANISYLKEFSSPEWSYYGPIPERKP